MQASAALLLAIATIACDPPTIECNDDDNCPDGFVCGDDNECVDEDDVDDDEGEEGEGEGEGIEGEGEGVEGEGEGVEGEGEGEAVEGELVALGAAQCCGLDLFRVDEARRADVDVVTTTNDGLTIAVIAQLELDALQLIDINADGTLRKTIVDDANGDVVAPSLARDALGTPHVTWRGDNEDGTGVDIRHALRVGDQWFVDEVADGLPDFPLPRITIDNDGLPWIVFSDVIFGLLRVANYTGDEWIVRAVDDTGTIGTPPGAGPDIVISPTGGLSYSAYASSVDGHAYIARELGGGSFELQLVDDTLFSSAGVSIAFDGEDDQVVAFGGTEQLQGVLAAYVARRHLGLFTTTLVDDSDALAFPPIVAAGVDGVWVAYLIGEDAGRARLAHAPAGTDDYVAQTLSDDGPFTSIALTLDGDGAPIVAIGRDGGDVLLAK